MASQKPSERALQMGTPEQSPPLLDIVEPPMVPFRSYVVDVSSRCDLACPGCQIFYLKDQSWQDMPTSPELEVLEQASIRINEHSKKHNVEAVKFILFGGEALMRGAGYVRKVVETVREGITDTDVSFVTTTNGIRLGKDPELRETLAAMDIGVAISLDGYREAHNKNRIHHNGKGTFDEVVNAINVLQDEHPEILRGVLCTLIDPHTDPVKTYETIAGLGVKRIDFLLDHGQVGTRQPAARFEDRNTETPYGDWLVTAFDRYVSTLPSEHQPEVRLFDNIMDLWNARNLRLRGRSRSNVVGLTPLTTVAISTDGSIRQDPGFNGAYEGAASTGLNIFEHSFDDALRHPAFYRHQLGKAGLSQTCQKCPIVPICGGGFPPHRYWNENPQEVSATYVAELFNYPSVFCGDLAKLICHIGRYIKNEMERIKQATT